jgi:hypothetical protein
MGTASEAPGKFFRARHVGQPLPLPNLASHQLLIQVHFWLGEHHLGLSHDRAVGKLARHRKLTGFHDQKSFLRHLVVYAVESGCHQFNKAVEAVLGPQHTAQFREDFGTELLDFIFGWFRN